MSKHKTRENGKTEFPFACSELKPVENYGIYIGCKEEEIMELILIKNSETDHPASK